MISQIRMQSILLAVVVLITAAFVVLLPAGVSRQIPVFLLLWIWPALTWSLLLRGHVIARFLLGAGLALFLNSFIVLLLNFLPNSPSSMIALLSTTVIALAPLFLNLVRQNEAHQDSSAKRPNWIFLAVIVLLALALRYTNMGYKELQGDEGVIMVRAAASLTGDDAEILLHQKGPMEILLPMATWIETGKIDDFWARLPFVWAGLLTVLAIYWLGRQWFQEGAGQIAALLFAVNGLAIAFSRIIQYQSVVMLFGILALLTAWRYRQQGSRIDLSLCAVFFAASLLGHYDALLVAPAIGWILIVKAVEQRTLDIIGWLGAILLGLVIIAAFYIPFVLSPTFDNTLDYLLSDRVGSTGSGLLLLRGATEAWRMSTFYNSLWYILGLMLLLLIGMGVLLYKRQQFAAVLYFAVPFLFYTLIVADPRTHIYTFFPGAVLLAGVGALFIWDRVRLLSKPILSYSLACVAAIWFVVIALYPYLMFVETDPERQRTWSENRPWPILYPVTWDEPPQYGLFGFPHQVGWRAVPDHLTTGQFPYASNEEEEITNWYMAQADRTHCSDFGSFLEVVNAQDEIPYDNEWINSLQKHAELHVNDEHRMVVYSHGLPVETVRIDATQAKRWLAPEQIAPTSGRGEFPVDFVLGDQVRLLGYDIDTANARPGGNLIVTLHWEALVQMESNYQVFVHLYDGEIQAQHDGPPECGIMPTTLWEPGQYITDTHILDLPNDMAPGSIPLLVGMYGLISLERLAVPGYDDDAITLTDVLIGINE